MKKQEIKTLKEKTEMANNELKKQEKFLKSKYFDLFDLKLHDIAYMTESEKEKNGLENLTDENYNIIFQNFCDISAMDLTDFCMQVIGYSEDKLLTQFARTSRLYLNCEFDINYHNDHFFDTVNSILENIGFFWNDFYEYILNEECLLDFEIIKNSIGKNDVTYDDMIEALDCIILEYSNYVQEETKDQVRLFDYIENFKNNQVENFVYYAKNELKQKEIKKILDNLLKQ